MGDRAGEAEEGPGRLRALHLRPARGSSRRKARLERSRRRSRSSSRRTTRSPICCSPSPCTSSCRATRRAPPPCSTPWVPARRCRPSPQVVRTPRTGNPIQHRIAIVVPDPPPASAAGWDADAPRAIAEPRLEAWAQGALGDPTKLEIAEGHDKKLADASLCALDVLYDADGDNAASSTLAARLRQTPRRPRRRLLASRSHLGARRPAARAARSRTRARRRRRRPAGRRRTPSAGFRTAPRSLSAPPTPRMRSRRLPRTGDVAALAPFGIRRPALSATLTLTLEELAAADEALVAEASARVAAADLLLARTAPPPPAEPPAPRAICELAAQALAAVFGAGFVALPVLSAAPAGESDLWADAVGPAGVVARPGADIRPWLARAGALRNATSAYGETLLVREAYGRRPRPARRPDARRGLRHVGRSALPGRQAAARAAAERRRRGRGRARQRSLGAIAGCRARRVDRGHPQAPPAAATRQAPSRRPNSSTSRRPAVALNADCARRAATAGDPPRTQSGRWRVERRPARGGARRGARAGTDALPDAAADSLRRANTCPRSTSATGRFRASR